MRSRFNTKLSIWNNLCFSCLLCTSELRIFSCSLLKMKLNLQSSLMLQPSSSAKNLARLKQILLTKLDQQFQILSHLKSYLKNLMAMVFWWFYMISDSLQAVQDQFFQDFRYLFFFLLLVIIHLLCSLLLVSMGLAICALLFCFLITTIWVPLYHPRL